MKNTSPLLRQTFVTAAICASILGHGCAVGFPAVLLPQLLAPSSAIQVDQQAMSWFASLINLPVLVGNFMMPQLMNRLGRKKAHILVILPLLAGWLLCAIADSYTMLMTSRALHGISLGMNLPLRSALIGEYTSPRYRGAFLMVISLAQAGGIFLVHLIGSIADWQKAALACTAFPFIGLLMTLYSPESPSYLAGERRFDECRRVFRWLRGTSDEQELEDMIEARSIQVDTSSLKESFKIVTKKKFFKPVTIMIHVYGTVQFAGATFMAVFATLIISLVAGSEANVNFWMIFLDAQRIVSNLLAVYAINKFKRRTMFFSISSLCIISQLGISGYVFARSKGYFAYESIWIPMLLINLQVFTVATGMMPLSNVISGEIFPFEYRGIGGSISVVSASVFNFFLIKTFITLTETIGIDGIYLAYSAVMIYFLTVVWFLLPETKGKTLQEIEVGFEGSKKLDDDAFDEDDASQAFQDQTKAKRLTDFKRKVSVISNHSLVVDI